jgi:hypothetical protein
MKTESWKIKLSILDKRIKSFSEGYRQNIALLGDDKDEISYLLEEYFQKNKSKDLIYIHLTTTYTTSKEFFKSLIFSILSEYLSKTDTLDNLINYASLYLVNTVNLIKKIFKKGVVFFLDILEVINKFINESGKKCIFIIEEFLQLGEMFPNFFKDFSEFIILQRNCMIILTSSLKEKAEKVLSTELNLLFGNFEKIFLNEIGFFNCYNYLKNYIAPLRPSPFFLSFFVKIIGSNIIYYNLIGDAIKNDYKEDKEEESIVSVIKNVFYLKETYLFQKFIKKIDFIETQFRSSSPVKILISISEGYIRKKELISLSLCDHKELNNKLQKLCDLGYVENLGNIYIIKDKLFSFWLSQIFKFYYHFPILDYEKRKKMWKEKMCESINLFKEEFFKDKVRKVLELISSFRNDVLKLKKAKYKLPLVERMKVISYPNSLHLIIGEGKEVIFIGVKENQVEDRDVVEFIEKISSVKRKNVKKIFISLERFTSSAKLIAKNYRLTTWDIDEVNSLLTIYNKSIISLDRI